MTPRDCDIALRNGWQRLEAPPAFVDESTYAAISATRATPVLPTKVSWYAKAPDRYLVCEAGDRYGCGDFMWTFTGAELDDMSEFVLCADSG